MVDLRARCCQKPNDCIWGGGPCFMPDMPPLTTRDVCANASPTSWRTAQGLRGHQLIVQIQPEGWFCPDILRWEVLGRADTWRGRAVLAFFWLMRAWPARNPKRRSEC